RSLGSIAVGAWPRTLSTARAMPRRSYTSPPFASCYENCVILLKLFGQTLRYATRRMSGATRHIWHLTLYGLPNSHHNCRTAVQPITITQPHNLVTKTSHPVPPLLLTLQE